MPTKDPEKRKANKARYRAKYKDAINAKRREKYAEKKVTNPDWVAYQIERSVRYRQAQQTINPFLFKEKRNAYRRKNCKDWVEKAGDDYINTLLSHHTGIKLGLLEVPKELLEAKRLQLMIKRELEK